MESGCDIAIVGAGAAGLAAAIFAGEAAAGRGLKIALFDGAKKPGAKILVSGGGRCNVTNENVTEKDYWGGPAPLIRSVLKSFDNRATLEWMHSLGVALKLEPTGKYFPVSDSARTVLDALLSRIAGLEIPLNSPARVVNIKKSPSGFSLTFSGRDEPVEAKRLIMATGGCSLPKSGSDGGGLGMARKLHLDSIATVPALAPLVLDPGAPDLVARSFAHLAGLTIIGRLELRDARRKKLFECNDSILFTHFGISGPGPMNLSRHWHREMLANPEAPPAVYLGHPGLATAEAADGWLQTRISHDPRRPVAAAVAQLWPERLARMLAEGLGSLGKLTRAERLDLARRLASLPLEVRDSRGWAFAETTAGGIDLREINPSTMAARRIDDLYLCGEMLDVDGRIGGFNFQWAWASGRLAGRAAVKSLAA